MTVVPSEPAYAPYARGVLLRFFGLLCVVAAGTLALLAVAAPADARLALLPGLAPGRVLDGAVLALIALCGAIASRMFWISYYAFKVKTFDPLVVPHHWAVVVQSPLVALGVIGLGTALGAPFTATNYAGLAFAFALGYFGEEALETFQNMFRAVLGKGPKKEPTLPHVDGVDFPLDSLLKVDGVGQRIPDAKGLVARLARLGVTHTHQLVARARAGRLDDLAAAAGVDEADLKILAGLGDGVRSADDRLREAVAQLPVRVVTR